MQLCKLPMDKLYNNRSLVIFFLFIFYPFGVYLMWKGKHFNPDLRWMISFIWLLMIWILPKPELEQKPPIQDCSKPIYADNCTYFRDSNCDVISKSCD